MTRREMGTYESPHGLRPRLVDAVRSVAALRAQAAVRIPRPGYHLGLDARDVTGQARDIAGRVARHGIAVLPSYVEEPMLGQLRDAFEKSVCEPAAEIPDALENVDFFADDPAFVAMAVDDLALDVAARYYRKPFFLGRAEACRLLPSAADQYGSYQWHHDTRGKQLKLMVLLSDVAPDGQRMRYVRGSHRRFYSHSRLYGAGSRFEHDVRGHPIPDDQIADVAGPAGTVAFFDTNGLHTGTRNGTAARDTVTVTYTTGRSVRQLRYRHADVEPLPHAKQAVITANPRHALI